MGDAHETSHRALSELPHDELLAYARNLGLNPADDANDGELLRLIRERQELLLTLDQQALLDICVWARKPVRQSAGKEELAREIAGIAGMRFDGLSHRGLVALARLRGADVMESDSDEILIRRMKDLESLWDKVRRKRRAMVGSFLTKMISGNTQQEGGEYHFLPEESGASLRRTIEEKGVVGGIAQTLRGAADDYVKQKLDEIEARIDSKLDEIDKRLSEWRDREIANRLKIIKITLIASILVAALSLGYSEIRRRLATPEKTPPVVQPVEVRP